MAMPHLGGWEWSGFWVTQVKGYPVTAVVEELEPRDLFDWFVELRRSFGFEIVALGPDAGPATARALKANHVLALLCDRDLGGHRPRGGVLRRAHHAARAARPRSRCAPGPRSCPTAIYFDGPDRRRSVVLPPLDTDAPGQAARRRPARHPGPRPRARGPHPASAPSSGTSSSPTGHRDLVARLRRALGAWRPRPSLALGGAVAERSGGASPAPPLPHVRGEGLVRAGVRLGIITPGRHADARRRTPRGRPTPASTRWSRIAAAADRLGFDHLTCSEHVAVPPADAEVRGAVYWDPLATLGCLAGHTERIRLATYVLVLGYHHPLELAKRYGTLDRISRRPARARRRRRHARARVRAARRPDARGRGERADDALRALRASMGRSLRRVPRRALRLRRPARGAARRQRARAVLGRRPIASLARSGRSSSADGWAPFGLKRSRLRRLARARSTLPTGFEVVAQPGALVDPAAEPDRVDELLGGVGGRRRHRRRPAPRPPLARALPRAARRPRLVTRHPRRASSR